MDPETITFVERAWVDLSGCSRGELWSGAHVGRHATLADHPGTFVARRSTGVRVSLPSSFGDEATETLAAQGLSSLVDDDICRVWAGDRGSPLIGPSVHAHLPPYPRASGPRPASRTSPGTWSDASPEVESVQPRTSAGSRTRRATSGCWSRRITADVV